MTCATDSENIEVVFNSCKDTVLRINFRWVVHFVAATVLLL